MTMPVRLNRRHFLWATTATLGVLALRGFPISAAAAAHFTHGVASGDPLQDRVILWTRVLPGSGEAERVSVQWQVSQDESFASIVSEGETQTDAERDYTVKVDAAGLAPGQSYYYRFVASGVVSPVGRTRTLPANGVQQISLAVMSCSNFPQGYFNVYREVANRSYDAVLHLGDYIYEYAEGGYANPEMLQKGRNVQPEHEIVSLEDYRTRYGLYRTDEDLQAVHRAHPFICVWDDHEITNNTWHSGAENHNEGEGSFADRRRAAIRAFYEWMPIREQGTVEQGNIYRSFDFGDLASLIMLDTRLVGRDEQLTHEMSIDVLRSQLSNASRTMLGADQEKWLEEELRRSAEAGIPWQVLGQQLLMGKLYPPQFADSDLPLESREALIDGRYGMLRARGQMGLPLNLDAWDGYPAARERALQAIVDHANNVVVLAGDTHSSWAFDLHNERGMPVAVELGTPSVSSPGFENFLPLPDAQVEQATQEASPELKYMKANGRGWLEVAITPDQATSSWHFVSSVTERDYHVQSGAVLTTAAGSHRLSRVA